MGRFSPSFSNFFARFALFALAERPENAPEFGCDLSGSKGAPEIIPSFFWHLEISGALGL